MDNPLVQVDPGLYIWAIVTFLVLLALLTKFAWTPLLQALESRRQGIQKALDDAQQAQQELERLNRESEQIIRQARVEADQIITMSRSDAERLKEEMRQKARQEAADLSVAIASKLIRRNLSKEDNQQLIDEALKQLES